MYSSVLKSPWRWRFTAGTCRREQAYVGSFHPFISHEGPLGRVEV